VAGGVEEPAPVAADVLVLLEREPNQGCAARVGALADERRVVDDALGGALDSLVRLAERGLVAGDTLGDGIDVTPPV
jgi:hypothetical protein